MAYREAAAASSPGYVYMAERSAAFRRASVPPRPHAGSNAALPEVKVPSIVIATPDDPGD